MNPKDLIGITEHGHTWLSELPAIPELAARKEHVYVVPWEMAPHAVVTMNPSVAFDAEAAEDRLDSALAATFPASDALSITQPGGGSPFTKGGLDNDDSQRRSPDRPESWRRGAFIHAVLAPRTHQSD